MAEAFFKSFNKNIQTYSAGTIPSDKVHPLAIQVMKEIGIDISNNTPKPVDKYINMNFDYVITVCGEAKENCPIFYGNVKNRIHIGFDDPAKVNGDKNFILKEFRRIRDEIHNQLKLFYNNNIKKELN